MWYVKHVFGSGECERESRIIYTYNLFYFASVEVLKSSFVSHTNRICSSKMNGNV